MNKCIITGRLTRDPEFKSTSNQTPIANFTIAVDRKFKDKDGNKQTDFIPCIAWRSTAEFIAKYFKKGNKIGISGSIQTRSYENREGIKVNVTEILVEDAEFLDSKTDSASGNAQKQPQMPSQAVPEESMGKLPFEL